MINTELLRDVWNSKYVSDCEPYPSSLYGRGVALLDIGVHAVHGLYDVVSLVLVHIAKTVHQVARTVWCSQTRSAEWALCKQHAISTITQPLKAFATHVGMIAANGVGLVFPEWGRNSRLAYGLFSLPGEEGMQGTDSRPISLEKVIQDLKSRSDDDKRDFLAGLAYLKSQQIQAVRGDNEVDYVNQVIKAGKNLEIFTQSVQAVADTRSGSPPRSPLSSTGEQGISPPVPGGVPPPLFKPVQAVADTRRPSPSDPIQAHANTTDTASSLEKEVDLDAILDDAILDTVYDKHVEQDTLLEDAYNEQARLDARVEDACNQQAADQEKEAQLRQMQAAIMQVFGAAISPEERAHLEQFWQAALSGGHEQVMSLDELARFEQLSQAARSGDHEQVMSLIPPDELARFEQLSQAARTGDHEQVMSLLPPDERAKLEQLWQAAHSRKSMSEAFMPLLPPDERAQLEQFWQAAHSGKSVGEAVMLVLPPDERARFEQCWQAAHSGKSMGEAVMLVLPPDERARFEQFWQAARSGKSMSEAVMPLLPPEVRAQWEPYWEAAHNGKSISEAVISMLLARGR